MLGKSCLKTELNMAPQTRAITQAKIEHDERVASLHEHIKDFRAEEAEIKIKRRAEVETLFRTWRRDVERSLREWDEEDDQRLEDLTSFVRREGPETMEDQLEPMLVEEELSSSSSEEEREEQEEEEEGEEDEEETAHFEVASRRTSRTSRAKTAQNQHVDESVKDDEDDSGDYIPSPQGKSKSRGTTAKNGRGGGKSRGGKTAPSQAEVQFEPESDHDVEPPRRPKKRKRDDGDDHQEEEEVDGGEEDEGD